MPNRPNLLWICTDQQRYDTIHTLNNPYIHTPNLNRLCADGVAFTRAYCQSPICSPSRASFLTGLYPSTVHVNRNGMPTFPDQPHIRLITRRLADVGLTAALRASCTSPPPGTASKSASTTAIAVSGVGRTVRDRAVDSASRAPGARSIEWETVDEDIAHARLVSSNAARRKVGESEL